MKETSVIAMLRDCVDYWEQSWTESKVSEIFANMINQVYNETTSANLVHTNIGKEWEHLKVFNIASKHFEMYLHILDGIDFRLVYVLNKIQDVDALHGKLDWWQVPVHPALVINKKPANKQIFEGVQNYTSESLLFEFEKMYRTQALYCTGLINTKCIKAGSVIRSSLKFCEVQELFEALSTVTKISAASDVCDQLRAVAKAAATKLDTHAAICCAIFKEIYNYVQVDAIDSYANRWICRRIESGFEIDYDELQLVKVVKASGENCFDSWTVFVSEKNLHREYVPITSDARLAFLIQDGKVIFEAGWWQDLSYLLSSIEKELHQD